MSGGGIDEAPAAPSAAGERLLDELIAAWRAMAETHDAAQPAHGAQAPGPLHACALFNRWDDNPLAQRLDARCPDWMEDRVSVPDDYFRHRSERAPFLLPLPEALRDPAFSRRVQALRGGLAECLEAAVKQVDERTCRQDFCGVVFSTRPARTLVRHWVALGHQRAPGEAESLLFRYHDPRVMQRMWPALDPVQQTRWLGPVAHWWSLRQPWGPMDCKPAPAEWWAVKVPTLPHGVEANGSPQDLFNEGQWFLSGISLRANPIWQGYAESGVAATAQPDAASMVQMLADGERLGLHELNLEDYVWTTWMHAPKEGTPRAIDWTLPHMVPILERIRAQLRVQPHARFSAFLIKAIQAQART